MLALCDRRVQRTSRAGSAAAPDRSPDSFDRHPTAASEQATPPPSTDSLTCPPEMHTVLRWTNWGASSRLTTNAANLLKQLHPLPLRTYVPMLKRGSTRKDTERSSGPLLGRLILLFASYAPVAVIVGLRCLPGLAGVFVLSVGGAGIAIWAAFLWWLPSRQTRTVRVAEAEFVDAEVTAYIVSILLPVIAASKPRLFDWFAYTVCALLILIVAFAAELWSVNPITYAFRFRAARATVDGKPQVVLVRGELGQDGLKVVSSRIGVTLVLESSIEETGANDKQQQLRQGNVGTSA